MTFPVGSPSWSEHGYKLVSVLPTQLFEAGALFALFAVLFYIYRQKKTISTTGVYLIGYAVIRFGIEILRGDPRAAVGIFSISQAISLGMLILGGAFIAVAHHNRRG